MLFIEFNKKGLKKVVSYVKYLSESSDDVIYRTLRFCRFEGKTPSDSTPLIGRNPIKIQYVAVSNFSVYDVKSCTYV